VTLLSNKILDLSNASLQALIAAWSHEVFMQSQVNKGFLFGLLGFLIFALIIKKGIFALLLGSFAVLLLWGGVSLILMIYKNSNNEGLGIIDLLLGSFAISFLGGGFKLLMGAILLR
jgi:hypothetical protein